MEDMSMENAKNVYEIICRALDQREWHYGKDPENLLVYFGFGGGDLPVHMLLRVDAKRQLIILRSPMPFKMSESKRLDGAVAVCAATDGLWDGSFDCDLSDGTTTFRLATFFQESLVEEDLIYYMIDCALITVEKYNGKFHALNDGTMTLEEFLTEEQK